MRPELIHNTRPAVAKALLSLLSTKPRSILDPCAGVGALLLAAASRWPNALLRGIEISREAHEAARTTLQSYSTELSLESAFDASWRIVGRRPDLILCNPPFKKERWNEVNARTDVRFFRRAASEVGRQGYLGLFMPNAIAAAPLFEDLRREILEENQLVAAVELPCNAFFFTDVSAVFVVLSRLRTDGPTRFLKMCKQFRVAECVRSDIDPRTARIDPYHYTMRPLVPTCHVRTKPLSELVAKVNRGRSVPASRRNGGIPYIAVADLQTLGDVGNSSALAPGPSNVEPGDILMARVGKRAGSLVTDYTALTPAIASDAVLILRPLPAIAAFLSAMLHTKYVRAQIASIRRGSAARLINKRELLTIRIPSPANWNSRAIGIAWRGSQRQRSMLLATLDQLISCKTRSRFRETAQHSSRASFIGPTN